MRRIIYLIPFFGILAACDEQPIVSAFNGDSVNIIEPAFSDISDEQLLAKATYICERGHKKIAEPVSKRTLPDLEGTEYLFLCLNK